MEQAFLQQSIVKAVGAKLQPDSAPAVRFGWIFHDNFGIDDQLKLSPQNGLTSNLRKVLAPGFRSKGKKIDFSRKTLFPLMNNLTQLAKTDFDGAYSVWRFLEAVREHYAEEPKTLRVSSFRSEDEFNESLNHHKKYMKKVFKVLGALESISHSETKEKILGIIKELAPDGKSGPPFWTILFNEYQILHPTSAEALESTLWQVAHSYSEYNDTFIFQSAYHTLAILEGRLQGEVYDSLIKDHGKALQDLAEHFLIETDKWISVFAIPLLRTFETPPLMDPDRQTNIENALRLSDDPDITRTLAKWKKKNQRTVEYTVDYNSSTGWASQLIHFLTGKKQPSKERFNQLLLENKSE